MHARRNIDLEHSVHEGLSAAASASMEKGGNTLGELGPEAVLNALVKACESRRSPPAIFRDDSDLRHEPAQAASRRSGSCTPSWSGRRARPEARSQRRRRPRSCAARACCTSPSAPIKPNALRLSSWKASPEPSCRRGRRRRHHPAARPVEHDARRLAERSQNLMRARVIAQFVAILMIMGALHGPVATP